MPITFVGEMLPTMTVQLILSRALTSALQTERKQRKTAIGAMATVILNHILETMASLVAFHTFNHLMNLRSGTGQGNTGEIVELVFVLLADGDLKYEFVAMLL